MGGRIAYWAVDGVRAALNRGDFAALEDFIGCWLEAAPVRDPIADEHGRCCPSDTFATRSPDRSVIQRLRLGPLAPDEGSGEG